MNPYTYLTYLALTISSVQLLRWVLGALAGTPDSILYPHEFGKKILLYLASTVAIIVWLIVK